MYHTTYSEVLVVIVCH